VLADRAYEELMSENCAHALEVVGTLPSKYRRLVKTRPSRPAASPRKDALRKISIGQTMSGVVQKLTDFGAFVNLGDVNGLIHISRLTTRRIKHPSEVVSVGQTVTVIVHDVDVKRERLSLAFKVVGK
jgi:ribosomal protein S1